MKLFSVLDCHSRQMPIKEDKTGPFAPVPLGAPVGEHFIHVPYWA